MGKTLKKKIDRQIIELPEAEVKNAVLTTSKRYKAFIQYLQMEDTTFVREYKKFNESNVPELASKETVFSIYGPKMPYHQYTSCEKKICETAYSQIKQRYINLTHQGHGYEDYRKFKYEKGKSMVKGFK